MSARSKRDERMEFWSLSRPSLLALFGLIAGLLGAALIPEHPAFLLVPLGGIACVLEALRLNRGRDQANRWRQMNMRAQRFYVVLLVFAFVLGTSLWVRHVSLLDRLRHETGNTYRAVSESSVDDL